MVYIVICRVVPAGQQRQAAVVVNDLDGAEREEEDGSPRRHVGHQEGGSATDSVSDEALDGVSVQGSEGVGHHETVVPRVDVPVQEPVQVHVPMPCVLPPI